MPSVRITLEGPADLVRSLELYRRWEEDLVDRFDGEVLRRTLRGRQGVIPLAIRVTGTLESPEVEVTSELPDEGSLRAVGRSLLVSSSEAITRLSAEDEAVADLIERTPAVRPIRGHDPFTLIVRSISSQQVNLKFATTVRRRLVEAHGDRHEIAGGEVWSLDPVRVAGLDPSVLREMQFTWRKAEYVIGLASAIVDEQIDLDALSGLDDDEVIAELSALHGIGRWTAEWYLVRGLGRARVVAGDLGVRKAVGALYGEDAPDEKRTRELTAHWGDAASVAQQLALESLYGGTNAGSGSARTRS